MPCINVREGDGVVNIYNLDACGTPEASELGLIQTDSVLTISWEESVTEGDTVRRTNFGGRPCYTDSGCDTLDYVTMNLTSCGLNPALDSALTGSALKLVGEAIRGYARRDFSCYQNVAIEILMQLDSDACEGGDSFVIGFLFPLVKNWRTSGSQELNGSDPLEPAYQGKAYKNANIFGADGETFYGGLDKWSTIAEFDPANDWFSPFLFDAADAPIPTASCDPVELALTVTSP